MGRTRPDSGRNPKRRTDRPPRVRGVPPNTGRPDRFADPPPPRCDNEHPVSGLSGRQSRPIVLPGRHVMHTHRLPVRGLRRPTAIQPDRTRHVAAGRDKRRDRFGRTKDPTRRNPFARGRDDGGAASASLSGAVVSAASGTKGGAQPAQRVRRNSPTAYARLPYFGSLRTLSHGSGRSPPSRDKPLTAVLVGRCSKRASCGAERTAGGRPY
jgi:hypothetical protein